MSQYLYLRQVQVLYSVACVRAYMCESDCDVCSCRHGRGRRSSEHPVSADEGPVELAVHRQHPEDYPAAVWNPH